MKQPLENSVIVPQEIQQSGPKSHSPASGCIPRRAESRAGNGYLYTSVQSHITQNVVYPYSGILFSHKNKYYSMNFKTIILSELSQ